MATPSERRALQCELDQDYLSHLIQCRTQIQVLQEAIEGLRIQGYDTPETSELKRRLRTAYEKRIQAYQWEMEWSIKNQDWRVRLAP